MTIDERISEALDRQVGAASISVPTAADIGDRGQRRNRRRRGALGLAGVAVFLAAVVGVGSSIDRRPSTELAAAVGATVEEFELQVPADFVRVGDGFVAFAGMPVEDGGVFRLLSSDDGVEWTPIDGSELSDWPDGRADLGTWTPVGVGFGAHDTTVHLVAGWAEPIPAGEQRPSVAVTGDDEVEATLTLAWARFDLEAGTWTTTVQPRVAALPDLEQGVLSVDLAASSIGVVANLTLQADSIGAALEEEGVDHDDVCAIQGGPVVVDVRACGSSEVLELSIPLSATTAARSIVVFGDTTDEAGGFEVVQSPSTSFYLHEATYAFDGGLGIASGLPSSFESHLGETTDGTDWADVSGPITRLLSVGARGDERVALSSMNANRTGPDRPIRVLWYSESGQLDAERTHVTANGDSVELLVDTYRINRRELVEANPAVDFDDLVVGTEIVIPDTDPEARNWRSIDLAPVFGDTPMSTVYFQSVDAGPGGFVVTALHGRGVAPSGPRPGLDQTTPFTIEHDGLVFEGSTPFGPATLRTIEGEIVETWFHFEAGRPDRHGTIDIDRHQLLIDVFDNEGERTGGAAFGIDEWFTAVAPSEPDVRVDLLWSADGIDWQLLEQLDGYPQAIAVDDDGVALLVTGRRFPTTMRVDFPD